MQQSPEPEVKERMAIAQRSRHRRRGPWTELGTRSPPPLPAVYAIFTQGDLIYVGSTEKLSRRLSRHGIHHPLQRERTAFGPRSAITVKYSTCGTMGDWLFRELRLIARLRPRLNQRQHHYQR